MMHGIFGRGTEPVSWGTPAYERRRLRIALTLPLLLVGALWAAWGLEALFGEEWYWLGIYPRRAQGLAGILLGPLLHADLGHAYANTVPLLVLGFGLFYFYPRPSLWVLGVGWLGTGFLTWLIGRASYHIGASGLVYCLAAFVTLSGIFRRQRLLAVISLVVIFLYGGMVWGVLPGVPGVSWEGHLSGGVVGLILAFVFSDQDRPRPRGVGGGQAYDYRGRTHTGAPGWSIGFRLR